MLLHLEMPALGPGAAHVGGVLRALATEHLEAPPLGATAMATRVCDLGDSPRLAAALYGDGGGAEALRWCRLVTGPLDWAAGAALVAALSVHTALRPVVILDEPVQVRTRTRTSSGFSPHLDLNPSPAQWVCEEGEMTEISLHARALSPDVAKSGRGGRSGPGGRWRRRRARRASLSTAAARRRRRWGG